MPYIVRLMEQFTIEQNVDFLIRILLACACGAMVGYERSGSRAYCRAGCQRRRFSQRRCDLPQ